MTGQELFDRFGIGTPFEIQYRGSKRVLMFTSPTHGIRLDLGANDPYPVNLGEWTHCMLTDWFEESPAQNEPGLCKCDLFSVLMVTGCQCGGQ